MAIVWGILTFFIMKMTIKYYLPLLAERVNEADFKTLEDNRDEKLVECEKTVNTDRTEGYICRNQILKNQNRTFILLIMCALFAASCGYQIQVSEISWNVLVKTTITLGILSCIFITDLEFYIIPNKCVGIFALGRVVTMVMEFIWLKQDAITLLVNSIIALVIMLVFLCFMSFLTKGGIGMGDVKILGGLGFMLGVQTVCYSMVFALLTSAIISVVLLAAKKKGLKDSLPLGPFIWLGYGITILLTV